MSQTSQAVSAGDTVYDTDHNKVVTDIEELYDQSDSAFCSLRLDTNDTITTGSSSDIAWDSEVDDVSNMHESATNPKRITIPSGKGGVYTIHAYIRFTTKISSNGINIRLISSSGGTIIEKEDIQGNDFAELIHSVRLSAGEYVYITVSNTTGGDVTVAGSNENTDRRSIITAVRQSN